MIRSLHSRWRKQGVLRRTLDAVGLSAAGVLTVVLISFAVSTADPAWWPGESAASADVIRQGEEVENALTAQFTRVRPLAARENGEVASEPWSFSLSSADANAWLATRMQAWMQSRGERVPKEVSSVRLAFLDDGLYAGLRVRRGGKSQVLWARVVPKLDERGLWLPAESMGAGKISLPASAGVAKLKSEGMLDEAAVRESWSEVVRVLEGESPALQQATVRIDSRRRVQLVGLRMSKGRVECTFRTVATGER